MHSDLIRCQLEFSTNYIGTIKINPVWIHINYVINKLKYEIGDQFEDEGFALAFQEQMMINTLIFFLGEQLPDVSTWDLQVYFAQNELNDLKIKVPDFLSKDLRFLDDFKKRNLDNIELHKSVLPSIIKYMKV
jgi:hypothetical protein